MSDIQDPVAMVQEQFEQDTGIQIGGGAIPVDPVRKEVHQMTDMEWRRMHMAFDQLESAVKTLAAEKADLTAKLLLAGTEYADLDKSHATMCAVHGEMLHRVKLVLSASYVRKFERQDGEPACFLHLNDIDGEVPLAIYDAHTELTAYIDSLKPKRDVAAALGVEPAPVIELLRHPDPEADTFDIEDFVGLSVLSGAFNDCEQFENDHRESHVVRFTLDGIDYEAVEDPDDGYRSSLRCLRRATVPVLTTFHPTSVICRMKPEHPPCGVDRILEIVNAETGKVIIEIGTTDCDDYYPGFVGYFSPENLTALEAKEGE